mgnify:CR=1 FL=1
MKYYAVLDTNVLVSALLKMGSVPGQVAEEALNGDIIPVLTRREQEIPHFYKWWDFLLTAC